MSKQDRLEQTIESLYRVIEFRRWVQTNVLFPTVPDSIVHPLQDRLREVEHRLLAEVYDQGALDRVQTIQAMTRDADLYPA